MPRPQHRVDPKLKEWATASQAKYIDAVNEHGSFREASRKLGVNVGSVRGQVKAAETKAAIFGYAPRHDMTRTVPEPFVVKGVSTYYDREGEVRGQWVKSKLDDAKAAEAIKEFVRFLVKDAKGLSPSIKAPAHSNSDLLAVYPMGDPHFGMYAWAKETGADFDLTEAERLTQAAIDRLVSSAPAAQTALLLSLGDFFHADNNSAATPASGHKLDVDSRFAKVQQVGLRAMRHAIQRLLEKHETVHVWMMPGNHDPHASYALALALDAFFDNQPRVTIDLSPSLYKYMRFGKVLIGAHHGHAAKFAQLPLIMATDRSEDWGSTAFRYWYCGHIHHKTVDKEHPGVMVETFRTLAAPDAYAAGAGYRAGRDMCLIVHHTKFGEVERHRCDIAMLGD